MNFYPHHIGDYMTATVHLSWLEDCAYRRLLDVYYSRECAIPTEIAQACRLLRAVTKEERRAVETVLSEFFTPTEAGWTHSRCEAEIVKAQVAATRSKANGMKGGRPAKNKPKGNPEETQQDMSGLSEETQSEPDPKAPITNPKTISNKPPAVVARASKKAPSSFEVTDAMRDWAALECPTVNVDKATAKFLDHTFSTGKSDWDATWRNWLRKDAEFNPAGKGAETTYQRSMRERVAEVAPEVARAAPGQQNPTEFFQTIDATAALRIAQ